MHDWFAQYCLLLLRVLFILAAVLLLCIKLLVGDIYNLLWPPYVIGQAIIFLPCGFFLLLSFFPHLISAVADWMSATWCGLSVNLECRSETCCTGLAESTGPKKIATKSPSGHHCTTLSGYIFATKACIDNGKKTC